MPTNKSDLSGLGNTWKDIVGIVLCENKGNPFAELDKEYDYLFNSLQTRNVKEGSKSRNKLSFKMFFDKNMYQGKQLKRLESRLRSYSQVSEGKTKRVESNYKAQSQLTNLTRTCVHLKDFMSTLESTEKSLETKPVRTYKNLEERINVAYKKFKDTTTRVNFSKHRFISDIMPIVSAIKELKHPKPIPIMPPPAKITKIMHPKPIPITLPPAKITMVKLPLPINAHTPPPPRKDPGVRVKTVTPIKVEIPSQKKLKGAVEPKVTSPHEYVDTDLKKLIKWAKIMQSNKENEGGVTYKQANYEYKRAYTVKKNQVQDAEIKLNADTQHWKPFLDIDAIKTPNKNNIGEVISKLKKFNTTLITTKADQPTLPKRHRRNSGG